MKSSAFVRDSGMLKVLELFPAQIEDAIRLSSSAIIPNKFKRKYSSIVFAGIGGSAISGDLIRTYIEDEVGLPIHVIRDYTLPAFVDSSALVFCISYSGDTEETLSVFKEIKKRKIASCVITSGGKLDELAVKHGDFIFKVPEGFSPRCALGYMLVPPLVMLGRLGLVKDKTRDLAKTVLELKRLLKYNIGPETGNNIALNIAKGIRNKIPIICSAARHTDAVARRWKAQINENAKSPAFCSIYPEVVHNEIEGWTRNRIAGEFVVINIRDKKDHVKVNKGMAVATGILRRAGYGVINVSARGDNLFVRIMALVYIGDFVSFYLSNIRGVDPTPINIIENFKKRLAIK